jgi:hypothetical protein
MDDKVEQCALGDTACEQRNDGVRFGDHVRNAAWFFVVAMVVLGVVSCFW